MSSRRGRNAAQGVASLWGAIACAAIASELYEDLLRNREFFLIPKPLKYGMLVVMALLTIEEVTKVRRRFEQVALDG